MIYCPKQEVDKIVENCIDIEEIFDNAYRKYTKSMTSVAMERTDSFIPIEGKKYSFAVRTKGAFVSVLYFDFDSKLFEAVVANICSENPGNYNEKVLYVTEYLNIICGRAISQINNVSGMHSRLSVPILIQDGSEEALFNEKAELSYQCLQGSLNIVIYYKNITVKELKEEVMQ